VQKKEKDRVLHENVLDVQDPVFLGGSSLGRLHAPVFISVLKSFCRTCSTSPSDVLLSDLWSSDAL
jgi:hypothetical protein